ncbi:MAG: methylated-DNA--[protein]-cysteine S-methyltransferase [Candidatus Rokubacteria bacterium]|nr:methylated-DNA--[protein]-cysteine S-methyltransferase [Candidatus Rokubacteria bacterium]
MRAPMELLVHTIESPIGRLVLVSDGTRLCALDFGRAGRALTARLRRRLGSVALRPARDRAGITARLRAYLAGDLTAIDAVPVVAAGTPFQARVWAALRAIPGGTTRSYADRAAARDLGAGARAIVAANGANPIPIVIPCHRLVGADGALTGYGGGLARKRWLLNHEGAIAAPPRDARRAGAAPP